MTLFRPLAGSAPVAFSPRRRFADRLGTPNWVPATGLLLALSFPPFPFYGTAWVALVPLLARWWRQPGGSVLLREAYAAFLIATTLGGYWVLFHADTLKALLGGAGLLLLPLPFAGAVVLSLLLARRLGRAAGLAALVAGWLAVEWAAAGAGVGAPWLVLGNSQAHALPFNQIADLAGTGGLSLWVWALNLTGFVLLRASSLTARFATTLGAVAVVAAAAGYGGVRAASASPEAASLRVVLVQPAYRASQWAQVASAERVQRLAELSDRALRDGDPLLVSPAAVDAGHRPDLIVWPEAALPVFPDARLQHTLYARVGDWTARRGIPLLTGAITRYDTAPSLTVEHVVAQHLAGRYPYYNSALLFDGAQPPQQYDKVVRVPAVDRVPRVGLEVGEVLGVTRSYGPGARRRPLDVRGTALGTLIGYEVWFGDHARRMARDGAALLVVVSNPSWWSAPAAVAQYEAATRLRAIESRRTVVTASVVGGSGLTLANGSPGPVAGWMEPRVLVVEAPLHASLTLYARHGDWLYRLAVAALAALCALWGGAQTFFSRERTRAARPRRSPRPV